MIDLVNWFRSLPPKDPSVHTWSVSQEEIQSLLDQQRKELLEKISLKPLIHSGIENDAGVAMIDGYNQAVADLEALKKTL